jgi:hypothetical protein
MRNLISDFRYGLRILLRSPGFALAAIVVLALGIGANTAFFSIVYAVLLRPLPYEDSSRIMEFWHVPSSLLAPTSIGRANAPPANRSPPTGVGAPPSAAQSARKRLKAPESHRISSRCCA